MRLKSISLKVIVRLAIQVLVTRQIIAAAQFAWYCYFPTSLCLVYNSYSLSLALLLFYFYHSFTPHLISFLLYLFFSSLLLPLLYSSSLLFTTLLFCTPPSLSFKIQKFLTWTTLAMSSCWKEHHGSCFLWRRGEVRTISLLNSFYNVFIFSCCWFIFFIKLSLFLLLKI